ncbi:NAC domain, putative [Plasmodium yoelii yoelii]|uniref:NAC domain, putative n=1 Tax=Plasmodium yoelii yoelii TaxID=73239 RepID=Q7RBD2_PLAYO|nr:NAC domain, putative [Plasmodium yoelii yoelii]
MRLSKKIEENMNELNMKNVSNILWSFSNINYTSKLIKNMKKIIEKNINNTNYIDIINIIYSLVKLNEYDEHLFNDIFPNFINVYIHNMNMKNLCMILWSYTYANIDNPDLYINILTKINENIKDITTKDIISILTCLSRIKYNYRYKYLFTHLKNKIIKNLYSFTPLQLTNIIYYSSFLDLYDHKYYYLLVQQIYQIRKLLYLENLTTILYALKNVSYLNLHNIHVFNLISYIFDQIKIKYKLLTGEDCLNIMLIMNDLEKYTTQGYLTFSPHNSSANMTNNANIQNQEGDILLSNSFYDNNKTCEKNYIDIFEEGVSLEELHLDREEIYFPNINDLLYEQIKIRLNNFWQLNIKDVNNLLIIMKNVNTYDPVIINMIMRQIIPILLKCSNIEFLIFLSNITANTNLKFIALTHMSRRPKLLQVFKKKINSITSTILNNYEEPDYSYQNEFNMTFSNILEEKKRDLINNDTVFSKIEKKSDKDIAPYIVDKKTTNNDVSITSNISENAEKRITKNDDDNIEINDMYNSLSKKKNNVDLNSCIALCYACFNIHYEDDNILKMYDAIEHMITVEKKTISSFMLINFLYILTLTNNKLNTVIKLSQEYMDNRYGYNIEKKKKINNNNDNNNDNNNNNNNNNTNLKYQAQANTTINGNDKIMSEHTDKDKNDQNLKSLTSFNLIYEENDGLSNYIEIGNEQTSLILLKLLYINIILNKYNYLYHILCEISKYNDNFYSYEFIKISKQVCYHIYNFSNFFSKNKSIEYTWNKVINNVYVNDEHIFLDLNYEKTNFNFIDIKKNHNIINNLLNNPKIDQNIDNNITIAKYFYYILNYNLSDINNATPITSKKDKKKIKMFHFDNVISDILNFIKMQDDKINSKDEISSSSSCEENEENQNILNPPNRPKMSKGERRARKMLVKLGLKAIPNTHKVIIKKSQKMIFAVSNVDIYQIEGTDSYVIFGDAKTDEITNSFNSLLPENNPNEGETPAEQEVNFEDAEKLTKKFKT